MTVRLLTMSIMIVIQIQISPCSIERNVLESVMSKSQYSFCQVLIVSSHKLVETITAYLFSHILSLNGNFRCNLKF